MNVKVKQGYTIWSFTSEAMDSFSYVIFFPHMLEDEKEMIKENVCGGIGSI